MVIYTQKNTLSKLQFLDDHFSLVRTKDCNGDKNPAQNPYISYLYTKYRIRIVIWNIFVYEIKIIICENFGSYMKNNITYTNFDKFVYFHFPSCMKKIMSCTKLVKSYTTLTIVYELLHSYTNLKRRILKFIYGWENSKDDKKWLLFQQIQL